MNFISHVPDFYMTTRGTLEGFELIQDASGVFDLSHGPLADTANVREYTEETAEGMAFKEHTYFDWQK